MQSCSLKVGLVLCLAAALAGCGKYNASSAANAVAQVTVAPTTISVVAGQVVQLTFSATNSSGGAVAPAPTFTFNSSNTKVATVSPSGLVCGGVWDSFFIVCNGSDAQGNPVAGTALITASAGGVSSAPAQATVHPQVSSIIVEQPTVGCFSLKQTHQFVAHACSKAGTPDSSGPCAPNSREITSSIGPFSWSSSAGGVASLDTNGVATASTPGLTGVIASAGTVSSASVPFRTCMPIQITLHINGDPAGQPTESATMSVSDTRTIQADMVDELGVTTNSAPVSIISNHPLIAAVSGVTLTGESPGGAGLVAACVPPGCGVGLNTPVYSNLFSVTVSSSSPATFVYATSSVPQPSATPQIVPIDTSKTPIVAGTAINLPGTPNSLIFTRDGSKGFMGTSAGIAVLNTATNSATAVDPFVGKVLAVSPDGSTAIFSNAANDPATGKPIQPDVGSQRLVILTSANNAFQSFVLPGAISAAFTADSSKAYIGANNGNIYVFSTFQTLHTISLGAVSPSTTPPPISGSAVVPGSAFAYFSTAQGLQVVSTCNDVQQPVANNPPTNTNSLQLVDSVQNANMIVAVDTTGIDIETATIHSIFSTNPTLPFVLSAADCTPPVSYSNEFHDFGVGPFTARQLVTPTNGLGVNNGSHIMVLPVGMHQLLVAAPGGGVEVIPLSGSGTDPLSGSMTLDGNTAWVGVAGSNDVHQILLTNSPNTADALQIAMPFTPNIVAVKPH